MLRKTQWMPEERSKLRPTDSRCYLPGITRWTDIKSRIHEEDVAGMIITDEGIEFVTKAPTKPKIDWLKINRECSE